MRLTLICFAMLFAAAMLMPPSAASASGASAGQSVTLSAQKRAPSATCLRNRQACFSGAARTGTYGARYVPPEVVGRCYDAYRACIGQR